MFDIGLQEMLVIGVLALLVFGPGKLPELGRMVGRALRELRRASDEFRSTVETNLEINAPDPPPPMPESLARPSADASTPAPLAQLPSETEAAVVEGAGESAVVATVEHAEPFCAQRASRIVHRSECAWVARIPEPERVYFKHVADARESSLLNCPVCEPWEPS
jgi:sec-independent protein translocase protein TatA